MFVNESTVRKYKADLTEEIEPQIQELIERAKRGAKTLEKRRHTLKAKVYSSALLVDDALNTLAGRACTSIEGSSNSRCCRSD